MLPRVEPSRESKTSAGLRVYANSWFSLRDRQKTILREALGRSHLGNAPTDECRDVLLSGAVHTDSSLDDTISPTRESELDASSEDFWKVLVIDQHARELLAPVLKVPELRACGVTLHLGLESARQPIPDVPAVYVIQPMDQNVQIVIQDCKEDRYARCSICFISSVRREQLERLADALARAGRIQSVTRVIDLYCGYVCLKRNLFTMMPCVASRSFRRLFGTQANEMTIQSAVAEIVEALFAVCVTLRCVPYIRCLRHGPAEMIAQQLCVKLWEYLHTPGGAELFRERHEAGLPPLRRPLLALLDRSLDLAIMLHHGWTYEVLIHELLPYELNRVSLPLEKPGSDRTRYDLDDESDPFWAENASLPFPQVAEHIESALTAYRAQIQEINVRTGASSGFQQLLTDTMDEAQLEAITQATGTSTRDLAEAVAELPRLTRRKRQLDMHTNIASALLERIKTRELDSLFQLEDSLFAKPASVSMAPIEKVIRSASRLEVKAARDQSITPSNMSSSEQRGIDCLRLLLIYLLLSPTGVSQAKLEEYRRLLDACGCPTEAIDYVIRQRAATLRPTQQLEHPRDRGEQSPTRQGSASMISRLGTAAGGGKDMFESLVNRVYEHGHKGLMQLASTVKGLIPTSRSSIVTRVVDTWMQHPSVEGTSSAPVTARDIELSSGPVDALASLLLDPLVARDGRGSERSASPPSLPFTEAIVFMVGGGNFVEWENLTAHIHGERQLIYGTTEMLSPETFVKELAAAVRPPSPLNGSHVDAGNAKAA
ncbi:Sec1 domain containing protein 1 [Cyanidiococcus yangmingshanensis]|uniref:Sec1 domain containing protein 1 n=1 Tax=Cyanidiococcus yangmingshanensis TaxID=2690220 RepID=A0A7J7IF52_9RHOD|nr:Sec1 domain containing protein 1 [Cyanidiococcus yangmingshanensis]